MNWLFKVWIKIGLAFETNFVGSIKIFELALDGGWWGCCWPTNLFRIIFLLIVEAAAAVKANDVDAGNWYELDDDDDEDVEDEGFRFFICLSAIAFKLCNRNKFAFVDKMN